MSTAHGMSYYKGYFITFKGSDYLIDRDGEVVAIAPTTEAAVEFIDAL